ncbi:hypothetical protein DL93DRAFT_783409 [Clavulina sp. PMI_390]|nr:hypothetical protein DL93DRAFT_783409 [Clavulina sp. PMI_390]
MITDYHGPYHFFSPQAYDSRTPEPILFPPQLRTYSTSSPSESHRYVLSQLYNQCPEVDTLCIETGSRNFFDVPLPANIRTLEFSDSSHGSFAISPLCLNSHLVHVSISCTDISFRKRHSDLALPSLPSLRTLCIKMGEQCALEVARVFERSDNLRALEIPWSVLCTTVELLHLRLGRTARGPAFRPKLDELRLIRIVLNGDRIEGLFGKDRLTVAIQASLSRILPFIPNARFEWYIPFSRPDFKDVLRYCPPGRSSVRDDLPGPLKLSEMVWTEAEIISLI